MFYTYEELSIGFGLLGATEFSINQLSDFDYRVVIYQKTLLVLFYAVFRHLTATQCISVFKYIYTSFKYIYIHLYLS